MTGDELKPPPATAAAQAADPTRQRPVDAGGVEDAQRAESESDVAAEPVVAEPAETPVDADPDPAPAPAYTPPAVTPAATTSPADKPEVLVGAAFAGAFLFAKFLRRLSR